MERLRASLDKAITARDQVELEAGQLAKELEKSQLSMTKNAEIMESSKKEHERLLAEASLLREERDAARQELRRAQQHQQIQGSEEIVRIQHDLQVAQRDRDKMAAILENREKHAEKIEKAKEKLEAEAKQLQVERDQLVIQLEKSQDMLMNFQQELNASEAEGEKQREELRRIQQLQQQRVQPTAESLAEVHRLTQQVQVLTQNLTKERQRAEQAEKRSQEGIPQQQQQQLEQWHKQLELEKQRADAADKRVQAAERQLHAHQQQIQQMQQQNQQAQHGQTSAEAARLRRELEKAREEVNQATVERERFQAQIEMLCQELQQNQVRKTEILTLTVFKNILLRMHTLLPLWFT